MNDKQAACWVYMLRCADGTFYTGQTADLESRLALHNVGRAARYTRGRGPVTLVYAEPVTGRGEALRREQVLRRLRRAAKEQLVAAYLLAQNGKQADADQ